jgi:dihydrofolate reductase
MLNAIIALSDDDVIGVDNALPWRLPLDMKRFKSLTTGHAVIMGRKTHESIGRPLPSRTNIVITKQPALLVAKGCDVFSSPERALSYANAMDTEPYVIGGAEIYAALWEHVGRVHITRVHCYYDDGENKVTRFDTARALFGFREVHRSDEYESDGLAFVFSTLERRS